MNVECLISGVKGVKELKELRQQSYCLKSNIKTLPSKSICLNSSATAGSDNSFNSLTPPNLKCLNSFNSSKSI